MDEDEIEITREEREALKALCYSCIPAAGGLYHTGVLHSLSAKLGNSRGPSGLYRATEGIVTANRRASRRNRYRQQEESLPPTGDDTLDEFIIRDEIEVLQEVCFSCVSTTSTGDEHLRSLLRKLGGDPQGPSDIFQADTPSTIHFSRKGDPVAAID